mgnify:FL=1
MTKLHNTLYVSKRSTKRMTLKFAIVNVPEYMTQQVLPNATKYCDLIR